MQQQIENEQERFENEPSPLAEEIFSQLAKPFEVKDIKWRVGATNLGQDRKPKWGDGPLGVPLAYVDARQVMQRLDDVVGPMNWQDEYYEMAGRTICKLTLRIGTEWVSKCDGAGDTNMEGEKGGISDAFKRAAVKFGVGRYLYALPNDWVELKPNGKAFVNKPNLPAWATPANWKSPYIDDFNEALLNHAESILSIRAHIDDFLFTQRDENSLQLAAQAWYELGKDTVTSLWRAPTKGGVFTTQQVQVIKSTEFREAYFGGNDE